MDWKIIESVPFWALLVILFNSVVINSQRYPDPPLNSSYKLDTEKIVASVNNFTGLGVTSIPNLILYPRNITYGGISKMERYNHRYYNRSERKPEKVTYKELENVFKQYLRQQLGNTDLVELTRQARGHKKKAKKYLLPMILGALLVKSLILPVVLKGLAILSSKAVLLSMISLIVASVSGLKRSARTDEKTEVQVIHVPVKGHGYKRYDDEEEHFHHHHHDDHEVSNGPYHRSDMVHPGTYR